MIDVQERCGKKTIKYHNFFKFKNDVTIQEYSE